MLRLHRASPRALASALALAVATAAPSSSAAFATPVMDGGSLEVGETISARGAFVDASRVFAMKVTIDSNVTVGSGLALSVDTFGSHALGANTEIAVYDEFGAILFAINNNVDRRRDKDACLAFGDAEQPLKPIDGSTRQSGGKFENAAELLAGTYLIVVGDHNVKWDEADWTLSRWSRHVDERDWQMAVSLRPVGNPIPTPAGAATLGLAALAWPCRRRRP